MCLFSNILTSLHSLNLSFSLLFYVISTAILKFPPWFSASPPWFPTFFAFPPRLPAFPRWFPAPAFPSHSSHFHLYSLHFPHSIFQFPILDFTDNLLSLLSLIIHFRKIVALVQKRTLPFLTTAKLSAPKYCLHHLWRHSIITNICLPYFKNFFNGMKYIFLSLSKFLSRSTLMLVILYGSAVKH